MAGQYRHGLAHAWPSTGQDKPKVQFEVETEFEAVKLLYDYYKLRDLISLVPANTYLEAEVYVCGSVAGTRVFVCPFEVKKRRPYLRWSSYLGSGQMTQLGLMANLSSYAVCKNRHKCNYARRLDSDAISASSSNKYSMSCMMGHLRK